MTIYMFNIRILCSYKVSYIRPSKIVSRPDFFKLEGRPLLFTIYEFFLLVSKMAAMS